MSDGMILTPAIFCLMLVAPPADRLGADADWLRVRAVEPAAAIAITVRAGASSARHFAAADQSSITVLNLTGSGLPEEAARFLRRLAARAPAYFAGSRTSDSFAEGRTRFGPNGLYVDGRQVAERAQIVENYARDEIVAVVGPVRARGSRGGAMIGGWVGFAVASSRRWAVLRHPGLG